MRASDSACIDPPSFGRLDSTIAVPHGDWQRAGDSPVAYRRDSLGQISEVRIGSWRVIAASDTRRIAEVRELSCERTAVLIERRSTVTGPLTSVLWQLYDNSGRLLSAIHSTPDYEAALMMNYQSREACRLATDATGEMRTVAEWRF